MVEATLSRWIRQLSTDGSGNAVLTDQARNTDGSDNPLRLNSSNFDVSSLLPTRNVLMLMKQM